MNSAKILVESKKCIECGKRCWPWQKWHPVNVIQAEHDACPIKKPVVLEQKSASDIAFEKEMARLLVLVKHGELYYDSDLYLYTTEDDYTFIANGGMIPCSPGNSLMATLEYF